MRLLVATTNTNKIREIRELLDGTDVELCTLADFPPVDPPEETGRTFAENARLKALYYARALGQVTVAEDSGLEIDALDGAPGVESARFGGEDAPYPEKFRLIYERLAEVGSYPGSDQGSDPGDDPTQGWPNARFVCALALARGAEVIFQARGTVEGLIAPEPKGEGGFGYDPIFFFPPFNCTLAEAGKRKAEVSHRAQAFTALAGFLQAVGSRL